MNTSPPSVRSSIFAVVCLVLIASVSGCADHGEPSATEMPPSVADTSSVLLSIAGFSGPEAVRYDAEQDVYFVSNFNRTETARDANGFISRMSPDGSIESLRFATGTAEAPLHEPRGMAITGDTLWAADVDGVHGFDRRTGEQLTFIDMSGLGPGFLNDIAPGPDGSLYVTDTGTSHIYRVVAGSAVVAASDSLLGPPNGITPDPGNARFLLAPWAESGPLRAWNPTTGVIEPYADSDGGRFDGIEVMDGRIYIASQQDSSIHIVEAGTTRLVIHTRGRPADIAIDTARGRIAVPYIALNRVDIWALPESG